MRRRLPGLLVVLASLVLFLAGFSVWVARQALDTDEWVDTSAAMIRDPAIQQATATYVADQLVDQERLKGRLAELLPKDAQTLAPIVAGAAPELAERATMRAMQSGAFQKLWETTNRAAHQQLVDLVEGDRNTGVVFDLRPMLGRVAERIGIGAAAIDRLPEDRGRIVVLQAEELESVRRIGRVLRALAVVLVLVAIALYAGAVYFAQGRRRETLLHAGLGIALAGLAILVTRRLVGGFVVDQLTANGAAEPAATATWTIGTSLLRDIAASLVSLGVVVMACAWLAGPARTAIRARTWIAPTLRERPAIAFAVAVAALLIALAAGILPGASRPLLVLIYVALVIAGVASLRRQVAAEAAAR